MKKSHRSLRIGIIIVLILIIFTGCNRSQSNSSGIDATIAKELEKGKVLKNQDSRVHLTVPERWKADDQLNSLAIIGASHREKSKYIMVLREDKKNYAQGIKLEDYFLAVRADILKDIEEPVILKPFQVSINGNKAMQFPVEGKVKGTENTYLFTFVETEDRFYQVIAWTLQSKFEAYREEFELITKTLEVKPNI